jgi:uncharacterized integral membrane protein
MQFLKTLFWVLIAVAAMLFAFNNWSTVTVNLWGPAVVDAKLPALLLVAFLLGLLPTMLLHRATRWSLKRKLSTMERALADVTTPAPEPRPSSGAIPPNAAPIAVPPGVA